MKLNHKIAVINPTKRDGLVSTVLDGLLELKKANESFDFRISNFYNYNLPLNEHVLDEESFIKYAQNEADFILLCWGKEGVNYRLAKKINKWGKTAFIDGSELGKDKRHDARIQKKVLLNKFWGEGKIDKKMLKKCALYFRREKPYAGGIIPLPFGIETNYLKYANQAGKKDIDFHCIFGQDDYPPLRKYAKELLAVYCKKNKFTCQVDPVDSDEFYKTLSRSKVGISISGGGFDTRRFWEILGNNCLLLTEKIDIYKPGSDKLKYGRIWQFNDLYDFQFLLERAGRLLRSGLDERSEDWLSEYDNILDRHSARSRVEEIIRHCADKISL